VAQSEIYCCKATLKLNLLVYYMSKQMKDSGVINFLRSLCTTFISNSFFTPSFHSFIKLFLSTNCFYSWLLYYFFLLIGFTLAYCTFSFYSFFLLFFVSSSSEYVDVQGSFFDGHKDKTLIYKDLNGKKHRRLIVEEHISLVQEPGSKYLGHVTPERGT